MTSEEQPPSDEHIVPFRGLKAYARAMRGLMIRSRPIDDRLTPQFACPNCNGDRFGLKFLPAPRPEDAIDPTDEQREILELIQTDSPVVAICTNRECGFVASVTDVEFLLRERMS